MALMLGRLNAALLAAGAPDDKAREAAEEVASYESAIAEIKAAPRLHTWMIGTNVALTLGLYAIILGSMVH